ncbi:MAG: tRNA (adenosine(37)-N6)-threonylcarbamoyltransferase complex ATPase subunit type 1 TsaE [Fimbriimonadaceae bacterium]|nr:tRNA (adenosine(37)-N6)-threonylcarbamoyltransferase complex ATPase subunit type 1 TsaE [Fimbriimonadaceae bacterium]QYK56217.1 MAG: tRNA (adenosine(37)-N6)-threonylcarbamoyltransferase complex ATPase subunit type 1 TsaE [Fimbriimonadaceae bacterium]
MRHSAPGEEATKELAANLAPRLRAGDVVLLEGEMGAGKTTFARGLLAALGWVEPVRSPTFPILLVYPTSPPVVHCDLYRVSSAAGLGLEDYLESHLVVVEWPERAAGFLHASRVWRIHIQAEGSGRVIEISPPGEGE